MTESPLGPIAGPRRRIRRRDAVWSTIIIIVALVGAWAILTQVDPPPEDETVATSTEPSTEVQDTTGPVAVSASESPSALASSPAPKPTSEPAAAPTVTPTGAPPGASTSASTPVEAATAASPTAPEPPPAVVPEPTEMLPAVVVLNDSRIGGLARDAAAQVANAGFTVERVGNYRGVWNTPVTTLYYEPGHEAAAQTLAERVPGVTRTVNIDSTEIPRRGSLLLVVTREFSTKD